MTSRAMLPALSACLLATAALAAGCGGSDGETTSAAASAPAAAAPPATASTPAATPPSDNTLTVTAKDFSFDKPALSAKAGKVTIDLVNMGPSPHELVVLKTDADPGSLPVKGGRVSEDASVGEVEGIASGAKGSHTFDLKPGKYVFVCNIPGHYAGGMRGALTVK